MASQRGSGPGTLVVRADADEAIGTGHVMRCLALAQAWQDTGGTAVFVCATLPAALRDRLLEEGIAVQMLSAPAGGTRDARETANAVEREGAPWVVLDGYGFAGSYQRTLMATPSSVLALDDFGRIGAHRVDVVLDQNFGANATSYSSRAPSTALLLGPRYALLRREFGQWSVLCRDAAEHPLRILVTLGGAGGGILCDAILQSLARLECDGLSVRVIKGAAALGSPCANAPVGLSEMQVMTNVRDMSQHMAWADLAVSACGSVVWELAFMGLPAVLIVVADNQAPVADHMHTSGAFPEVISIDDAMDGDVLVAAIRRLLVDSLGRRRIGDAGRMLVDGRGAVRVAEKLLSTQTSRGERS